MTNLKKKLVDSSFFLEVLSNGSTIPTLFNRGFYPNKEYSINKLDVFTGILWQKANRKFVSTKDEESAKRFTEKYKLS